MTMLQNRLTLSSPGKGAYTTGDQNCLLLTCEGGGKKSGVLLDCGQTNPSRREARVNGRLTAEHLPSFEELRDVDVVALLLSHIHYDHSGAVERLLELRPEVPVVGSRFSLDFIRRKILRGRTGGLTWDSNSQTFYEPFFVSSAPVLHSTPGSLAFRISVAGSHIVYSGDMKTPGPDTPRHLRGKYDPYWKALEGFGSGGVDVLIGECTNADEEGFAGIEEDVTPELEKIILRHPHGRVFFTLFSSHVERMESVIDIADRYDRKVYVAGQAIKDILHIAGIDGWRSLDGKSMRSMPKDAIVLVTGGQAEPDGWLNKLAEGRLGFNPYIGEQDVLAVLADTIPVAEIWEDFPVMTLKLSGFFGVIYVTPHTPELTSLGAKIIQAPIHVTGHGKQGDIEEALKIWRPKLLIPVHGDLAKRQAMAGIAEALGIPSVFLESGEEIELPVGAHL